MFLYNQYILDYFLIQLYIEVFPLIVPALPIPLFIQLRKYIRLVYKEVSYYYYIIIAFSISFFKPSQNPQILFLFQFVQLFSPRYACSRPISNLSYRFPFSKSYFSKFRNLLQIRPLYNLTSELLYISFFLFKLCSRLILFRRFLFFDFCPFRYRHSSL